MRVCKQASKDQLNINLLWHFLSNLTHTAKENTICVCIEAFNATQKLKLISLEPIIAGELFLL